jgi:hypothetical protein
MLAVLLPGALRKNLMFGHFLQSAVLAVDLLALRPVLAQMVEAIG